MTTVYLIRHGVTDWMEEGLIQGSSDRPLSEFGKEQADLAAKALKNVNISRIITSPQLRAVQTAEPICDLKGLDAETIDGLQERDHGWWEGKSSPWRMSHNIIILREILILIYFAVVSLTGESSTKFEDRVIKTWNKILSTNLDESVIIVAHFGVLRTILKYIDGGKNKDPRKFFTENCSISIVEINSTGKAGIVSCNDTVHLNGKVWNH